MAVFIVKLVMLSAALSIAIKYGGPLLPVSASPNNALIAVWLPVVLMAAILAWRWQQQPSKGGKS